MINRDEDGRHSQGPGCIANLLLTVVGAILVATIFMAEVRLERIETKLGMPHCGIFYSATWDGKTCKEAPK